MYVLGKKYTQTRVVANNFTSDLYFLCYAFRMLPKCYLKNLLGLK